MRKTTNNRVQSAVIQRTAKMAAQIKTSIGKRLKRLHRPYRSSCEYIHPEDYVPSGEFFKLHIADSHWIDWNNSTKGNRGITTNPRYLLDLFGNLCGDTSRDLRTEMINHLSKNSDYYGKKLVVCFIMNGIDIIDWMARMSKPNTPIDEIGIYILSNMLDFHTTVYRSNRLWSTLELSGATEDSLVANSDLLLVWIEPGRYCVLREKQHDTIKPAELTGHVTIDPVTKQLVYTPWNLSETHVARAVEELDMTRVKKEVIEISDEETTSQTIELGRIMNYSQLREIFLDRSPLHSDTETGSDSEHLEPKETESERSDPESLLGATEHTGKDESPKPVSTEQVSTPDNEAPPVETNKPERCGVDMLHGATVELSHEDLLILQQELELSDDNDNTTKEINTGITDTVKGATCTEGCDMDRTLEDAIWKESSNEFLIVDDELLGLPDCFLSIKNLSDREIEIQLNPRGSDPDSKDKPTESPLKGDTEESQAKKDEVADKAETKGVQEEENTEPVKPKIKIGTGKLKKRSKNRPLSSSESDTPRYSMRVRPTPRRLSTGGRNLRAQIAINYQETYDYRTGRNTTKPKTPPTPSAALSAPTEARQAAQAAIKDPTLLGATPAQTIPVLVLHSNAGADSDDTVVYEDDNDDTSAQVPEVPETEPERRKNNQKVRGSIRFKRYVIRRPKQKKKTKKYKCVKCRNRYDCIKTLNRHFRKRHRKLRCVDCGKLCNTPETLRHHAYDHSLGDRFSCKHCNEKFVFKSYLKVHLLKHKGKATFRCQIINCNKKFTYKGELVRHMKEHDDITWTCRKCDYETDTERKLNQHMNSHLQIKKFTCKYCGEKFVHSNQLVRHYLKCEQNPNNME